MPEFIGGRRLICLTIRNVEEDFGSFCSENSCRLGQDAVTLIPKPMGYIIDDGFCSITCKL